MHRRMSEGRDPNASSLTLPGNSKEPQARSGAFSIDAVISVDFPACVCFLCVALLLFCPAASPIGGKCS